MDFKEALLETANEYEKALKKLADGNESLPEEDSKKETGND